MTSLELGVAWWVKPSLDDFKDIQRHEAEHRDNCDFPDEFPGTDERNVEVVVQQQH